VDERRFRKTFNFLGRRQATGVVVNSTGSITAVSPAHAAGTVDVTVTTASGTSAVAKKDNYKYK